MNKILLPISHYSSHIQIHVEKLIETNQLTDYLLTRYPQQHTINSEKALYEHTQAYKKRFIKQSAPISKVVYDSKIQLLKHALGTHSYVSRVQGGKLKAKQEIRIATLFKIAPQGMLDMIVVHELAHLKEKQHNKAFYKLCCYMLPDYHQLELDTRLFLIDNTLNGNMYAKK